MPKLASLGIALGRYPHGVMLSPNPDQCTARLCSYACGLGCAHGGIPRGQLSMGVLFAHGLCAIGNRASPSPPLPSARFC